jgi:tetratricopeptide (TPR) repeat protein
MALSPATPAHQRQPTAISTMPVQELPEKRQAELKASLEAAAIPRWCNEAILAALLDLIPAESADRLARLRALNMVEPFPARGEGAIRVQEATRRVLRRIMATVEPGRFRTLSLRMVAHFQEHPSPAARIEWIFHLLCGDPERGADELEKLDHEWSDRGHPEERQALAMALRELEETGMVAGRARAWVLLVMAWTHELKGETARWAEVGEQALRVARDAGDRSAEAESLCLVGDARKAQHKFEEAAAAFDEFLLLGQRQVQQHPDSPDWQRKLAAAHSRVGDAGQARGQLEAAQSALTEYLAISRRMARQYPGDAGWQRELGVAHAKMGHVMRAQGQLERARAEFADYLTAFRRLVEQDPGNLGWQRELAVACGLLAHIRMALDGADSALPYYEESSRILTEVVERAPGIAQWAEDKRLIDKELAACRRSREVHARVKNGLAWLQDKLPF